MLIKNFNLIDIKNYENKTGNNILSFFTSISFANLIDLIKLGNGNCGDDRAAYLLDLYLQDPEHDIVSAMIEIKNMLIGIGDNNSDDVDNEDTIDITEYKSLTDLYIMFSMQLISAGLDYTAFWSMTTKEMYQIFNSIVIKLQNDTNRELNNMHTLAAMVGASVWGKLQKEPPKVDIVNNKKTGDEDVNDMSVETAMIVAKLKALEKTHNNNLKGE